MSTERPGQTRATADTMIGQQPAVVVRPGGGGYGRGGSRETKPFFLTSELLTLCGVIAALAIAAAVLDNFNAKRLWVLIPVAAAAYMISRGFAKSGVRSRNPDHRP
jgi:hypothetical protein